MSEAKALVSPRVILITTILVAVTMAFFACRALSGAPEPFKYFFITVLLVVIAGWKVTARRLPWSQVVCAGAAVLAIHFCADLLAEEFPIMIVMGDKLTEFLCVGFFGVRWVRKGYISPENNKW